MGWDVDLTDEVIATVEMQWHRHWQRNMCIIGHDMLLVSLVKFVQELLTVATLMGTGKLGDLLPIMTIVLGTRALVDGLMAIEGVQAGTSCWGVNRVDLWSYSMRLRSQGVFRQEIKIRFSIGKDNMLFTHETNADQFDLLSYGNLRGLEASRNSEESNFGNDLKDGSSVSSENFSSSCLPGENYQSATIDHDKRPLSDVKPCQVACKRPKQTDHHTWLYSFEEDPLTSEVGISSPALADGLVETKQPNDIPAISGATTCSGSSDIPCLNHDQSVLVESLDVPDWATSFPGYFEDCGPVATYNHVDDIGSPVHEYLPRKGVPIGPEHQADIPEWKPRISMIIPGASEFCDDLDCSSASTSESVPRGDDYVSDKWIRYCVVPMTGCSSLVDWAGDNKIDCNCSDEGSMRCSRQHIIEARDNLKMSLGQDTFRELGLCEMGEDVAQRWTDEEEKLFQRVVFLNPVSLGKNFWDHLPDAFPGKTSQELVSYYFNVFMLRKRAQQNRSDVLRVDSDDDELHGEPLAEREEGDPAVEFSIHEHFVSNSLPMDDDHKEFERAQFDGSLCEKSVYNAVECRHLPNQMPADSNTVNTAQDVYDQDNGAQCAEFHMSLPNDTSNNLGDQSASV